MKRACVCLCACLCMCGCMCAVDVCVPCIAVVNVPAPVRQLEGILAFLERNNGSAPRQPPGGAGGVDDID